MLHSLLRDVEGYTRHTAAPATPPTAETLRLAARRGEGGGEGKAVAAACEALDRWLAERRANCPLPPQQYMTQFLAKARAARTALGRAPPHTRRVHSPHLDPPSQAHHDLDFT